MRRPHGRAVVRVLIVGAGSIGSRRARLLAEMGHEVTLYDLDQTRASCAAGGAGCAVWDQEGRRSPFGPNGEPWSGRWQFDAAFVCTPADTHIRMANHCISAGWRGLFIEKPLSTSMDGIPELIAECEARGVVTMGACNMRWAYPRTHELWPRVSIEDSRPLDDWRPGARDAYGQSGIVLEAGIHWLDLAAALIGRIEEVELEAEGCDDDHIRLLARHAHRSATILLDWRPTAPTVREVIVSGRGARRVLFPDWSDEMYRSEMAHFLAHVESGTATTNPIANAAETLRWALKARDMCRAVAA